MSDIPNGESQPNGFRELNNEKRNPLPVMEPLANPRYLSFESEFM
jgi:hypothetical protein